MSNVGGKGALKQLCQFHQSTQAVFFLNVAPRKLNGFPLRTRISFTYGRQTLHVGTNMNTGKKVRRKREIRNQSRETGTEAESLLVAAFDGEQQEIHTSNLSVRFREKARLSDWV